jgi:peptidoglycan/LPS O-acetylase OafA/YrhL
VDSERSARASRNNFDLIRLLAAIGVLVSHAFSLAGAGEPMIAGVTVGTLGVYVFFVISGYLILKSWTFDPRVSAFLVKRCLRIFPGLLGAVLFTALVVGPLSTSHTLSSYFTDPQTAQFVGGALVLFAPQGTLPGVFAHNPFGGVINGSLWSLTYEFALYLMVAYFGRLLRWHAGKAFALGLFVSLLVLRAFTGPSPEFPLSFTFFETADLARLAIFFAGGMVLFAYRDSVPLRGDLCLLLSLVWAVSWLTPASGIATAVVLPYLVMYLALRRPPALSALTARGDISYGVYIYAFPIEQLAVDALGARANPLLVLLIALPTTVLLAALSWRLIERRCLDLKRRLNTPSQPSLVADEIASRPASMGRGHPRRIDAAGPAPTDIAARTGHGAPAENRRRRATRPRRLADLRAEISPVCPRGRKAAGKRWGGRAGTPEASRRWWSPSGTRWPPVRGRRPRCSSGWPGWSRPSVRCRAGRSASGKR